MPTIGIELTATCNACEIATPITALASEQRCRGCQRSMAMPWDRILFGVRFDAREMASAEQRTSVVTIGAATVHTIHVAAPPSCPACHAAIELTASRCSCGEPFVVRDAHAMGVRGLLEVAGETAAAPSLDVACAHCGATIHADGSTRVVTCRHCGSDMVLGDDVWTRLSPARRRLSLVFDASAKPARDGFRFELATELALGSDGTIYARGLVEVPGGVSDALWAYDADLRLRWVREIDVPAQTVAWIAPCEGGVVARIGGAHPVMYDARSGEPRAAPTLGLDLATESVILARPCADGSWLALSRDRKLRRYASGQIAAVFPDRHVGLLSRVFGDPWIVVTYAGELPGGDLATIEEDRLTRYDRAGNAKLELGLAAQYTTSWFHVLCGDEHGGIFTLRNSDVWRYPASGPGLALPVPFEATAFVVVPDGVWVFGDEGRIGFVWRIDDARYALGYLNQVARHRGDDHGVE